MSSTKPRRLAVPFGLALLATAMAAHAASVATPSFAAAIAPAPATTTPATATSSTSVHVVHTATTSEASAPVKTQAIAPASTGGEPTQVASAAHAAAPASGVNAVAVVTGESHLTLHDIDELARSKLTRALRGDGDAPASSASVSLRTPVPVATTAVAPAPEVRPFVPRERTTPVTFVGAYSDSSGQHVLYQYNGAVYPARVGEKLLNGWIARRVDGLSVTVAEGKRTWSVAMSGGAQEIPVSSFGGGATLGDLSSPLPSGVSLAQPISRFGR